CPTSLFFNCARHHRYPHSFPTRRSSDLRVLDFAGRQIRESPRKGLAGGRTPVEMDRMAVAADPFRPFAGHLDRDAVGVDELVFRSEEHTSELQSQSNLVCRLLLEKKKNN